MNKKKLIIIIVLMFVSTIGIFFMQFLWVNNVIHLNEKQFEQNVYAALKNIVSKIEKQSYAVKLNGEFINIDKRNTSVIKADSSNSITIIPISNHEVNNQKIIDSIQNVIDIKKNQVQKKVNDFNTIYNQLQIELQNSDDPLKRVNLQIIDSAIYKELLNTGITTDYEFAVLKKDDEIIFKSAGFKNVNINSRYKANLFPTDAIEKQYYLLLDVPLSYKYGLNKSLSNIFIFSTIISLITILIFYLTVRIILKQKRLDVIKTDFINNISHELKTPIASLQVAINTLKHDKSIRDNSTIALIERQGNRLQKITDRVIESSFNNIPSLKKEKINAKNYIEGVYKDFKASTEQANIRWYYNLKLDSDTLIFIDHQYFTSAMINILDNAVQYNDKAEKRISILGFMEKNFLVIEIKDNGIGIPAKDIGRVFDKFFRSPKGNIHNVKGLGIGLFFSKQIIELHNATINFQSIENKGTSFIIKIPVYE